jgi:hypothetical protein
MARIATSSIHHCGKRTPRRIRQSGSALRKLIRSAAAAGLSSEEAKVDELVAPTKPQLAGTSQRYWDRLLMGPDPPARSVIATAEA